VSAPAAFDALVLGAGPAGLAFALAAAQAGMRVALVGRPASSQAVKVGEVLPGSVKLPLHALGAGSAFERAAALPGHGTASMWSGTDVLELGSLLAPYGTAWHVDRTAFEEALRETAIARGVTVLLWGRASPRRAGRGWTLMGPHGAAPLTADLLVLATGRSPCPLGFGARGRDDKLIGVLAYLDCVHCTDPRFHLEACARGWWYSAPLPNGRLVVAYLTDSDLLPAGCEALRQAWAQELSKTRLVSIRTGTLAPRSLVVRRAGGSLRETLSGDGWVAIGDAAAAYDPLCGQGVTSALSKGFAAARLLAGRADREGGLAAYAEAERDTFSDYLVARRSFYASAGRGAHSEFWRSRCGTAPSNPVTAG
jgi:flavin-dependent dehydrogenase